MTVLDCQGKGAIEGIVSQKNEAVDRTFRKGK